MRSDSTVAQLHEVLQVAFGWDDDHLNRFVIRGREYAVYRDGGGMIGIDVTGVRLDALGFEGINFAGIFVFPLERYRSRLLPSSPQSPTTMVA